jgi:cytochrome c oxidase accessory protein FixG
MPNENNSKKKVATSLYKKRDAIYTKVIKGPSQYYRVILATLVYGGFFLLPWITYGDRPAIFFDLEARQFHILAFNFWPQDFMYLAWLLIIAAFSLFLFTTVAGRLWCGFVCPQTIWTFAFIWIEQKIEGKPHIRKNLDAEPFSLRKLRIKTTKHVLWLLLASATGITFVAYFYPIRVMITDIQHLTLPLTALVWIGIFTYLTYLDAGWLREQVCIYMCPYARFQSVMYDKNTLLVAYNEKIGEPRASVKSHVDNAGQCIDCEQCVQVCPTGIDIRHGSQIACINCALCIDACNEVMASVNRPTNLITFTTLDAQEGEPLKLLRPKTIAYSLVLVIMCTLFVVNLWNRSPLEASILRDRDNIFRIINETTTANDYVVKLANKSQEQQNYQLKITNDDFTISNNASFELAKAEAIELDITITTNLTRTGSQPISIEIISEKDQQVVSTIETRFIFAPK